MFEDKPELVIEKKKDDFKEKLSKLTKDELVEIILSITENNRKIKEKIDLHLKKLVEYKLT